MLSEAVSVKDPLCINDGETFLSLDLELQVFLDAGKHFIPISPVHFPLSEGTAGSVQSNALPFK